MIKTDVIIKITKEMAVLLTEYQLEKLKETLKINLEKINLTHLQKWYLV